MFHSYQLQQQVERIDYTEGLLDELENRKVTINNEARYVKNKMQSQRMQCYETQYEDPEPNFNRKSVNGTLGTLFTVKDPKYNIALSTCCGGSLRHWVVDTEVTSKKLLTNGKLRSRTTIIPINKIVGGEIPQQKVEFAQRLVGRENCIPAIDCIDYHPSLREVMRFKFGHLFICKDMDTANKVTFHPNIHTRSITLDGDVFDPEGILSGGAREEGADLMAEIAEYVELKGRLVPLEAEWREMERKIAQATQSHNAYNKHKNELDAIEMELKTITTRLAQTSFQKNQQEIEDAKNQIGMLFID